MRHKKKSLDLLRNQLESGFSQERQTVMAPPTDGWIRTLRLAFGMNASQLAKRLGVSKQAVTHIERSEREGTLNLTTYRKVAEALGCQLKVVLVPKKAIKTMVCEQALHVAKQIVQHSSHQMNLEAQGTKPAFRQSQVRALAEELVHSQSKKIWEDLT